MPKHIFCANCGIELLQYRKAIKGNIFDLVEPHNCIEEGTELPNIEDRNIEPQLKPNPPSIDKLFGKMEFVQKLNDLTPEKAETGDKRSKEFTRKELETSSAPFSILDQIKVGAKQKPDSLEGGQEEPDEES